MGDFMRKIATVLCLLTVLALSGCEGDLSGGITQQEQLAEQSYFQTERIIPAEADLSEISVSSSEEADASTEESEEAQPMIDPVALTAAFSQEILGLEDNGRIYIFRDKNDRADISGLECCGVSCYDELDGTLHFVCDFYVSTDGSRIFRLDGDDFITLPESARLDGFTPEQEPENIMEAAVTLYSAVYGIVEFDRSAAAVTSDMGNYYPVADERIDTRLKLNAALSRYFTGDLLAELLSGSDKLIADESGKLYCLEHSGGNLAYMDTEYSLASLEDGIAVYDAVSLFEYEAGEIFRQEYTLTAVKTQSGWRFSEFYFPF